MIHVFTCPCCAVQVISTNFDSSYFILDMLKYENSFKYKIKKKIIRGDKYEWCIKRKQRQL